MLAGDVGYIIASIKNVRDNRRRRPTVTLAANPARTPLPGYKKVQPMVYCCSLSDDGARYPDLRDALESCS